MSYSLISRESGVGSSGNEVYKTDGSRIPNGLHPFEDRSFRFKKEEYGLCLYGVFDGFSGGQVADFVMKRLPAELLLGQLVPDLPPEMVREQLKQAFISVDREYFGIIGDRLAARMVMRGEEDRPGRQSQLAELEEQISSGSVAAVALLLANQVNLRYNTKFKNLLVFFTFTFNYCIIIDSDLRGQCRRLFCFPCPLCRGKRHLTDPPLGKFQQT